MAPDPPLRGSCELSVVVPIYNEEACARTSIGSLLQVLDASGLDYEVVAVNNGSRDGTAAILAELATRGPRLYVLNMPRNLGYGGGIRAGLDVSRGRVLGFTCSDGEVAPEDVIVLHRVLRAGGVDVVKGKRIGRVDGFVRQLFSFGYHVLVAALFRIHVTDVNGYPLLMTREAYRRISLTAHDWMVNVDLLMGARRQALRTVEVDVSHRPRLGGRSKVRLWFPLLFLWQMLRFRMSSACRTRDEAGAPAPQRFRDFR